jgi:hypothetical protein
MTSTIAVCQGQNRSGNSESAMLVESRGLLTFPHPHSLKKAEKLTLLIF